MTLLHARFVSRDIQKGAESYSKIPPNISKCTWNTQFHCRTSLNKVCFKVLAAKACGLFLQIFWWFSVEKQERGEQTHISCLPVWKKTYTIFLCIHPLLLQEGRLSINKCWKYRQNDKSAPSTAYHAQSNGIWESSRQKRFGFVARYLEAEINGVKNCGGGSCNSFCFTNMGEVILPLPSSFLFCTPKQMVSSAQQNPWKQKENTETAPEQQETDMGGVTLTVCYIADILKVTLSTHVHWNPSVWNPPSVPTAGKAWAVEESCPLGLNPTSQFSLYSLF